MDWKSTSQIFSNLLELLPGHSSRKASESVPTDRNIYTRIYVCVYIYINWGLAINYTSIVCSWGNYKRKKS